MSRVNSEVEIVRADLGDASHQQAIVQLVSAYAQDPIIGAKPIPAEVQAELIPGLQQLPTTVVLLAYKDTEPVGIAVCFRGFSTFAAKPLLNLHDLAVAADHRGQGIGSRLLNEVAELARQLGCCKVTLEVLQDNHPARKAYKAAGFEPNDSDPNARESLFLYKNLH